MSGLWDPLLTKKKKKSQTSNFGEGGGGGDIRAYMVQHWESNFKPNQTKCSFFLIIIFFHVLTFIDFFVFII